jgi:WD40 repeat protein
MTGHRDSVEAVATVKLPDGRPVAVSGGGYYDSVWVWDLTTGTAFGEPMIGHRLGVGAVAAVELSGRRPVAVTGGHDGTVRL